MNKKSSIIKTIILIAIVVAVIVAAVIFLSKRSSNDTNQSSGENLVKTTISITCDMIKGANEKVPADGIILQKTEITLSDGESVYDQLAKIAKEKNIQFEKSTSSSFPYISGLGNIYGGDFGKYSGWMFKVNGEYSQLSCDDTKLKDGDCVEWVFTDGME